MAGKPWEHEEEEDHGEELWIVSYADMVTLLFGFFVILYSFSTIDDKKFDQMSDQLAQAFDSKAEKRKKDGPEEQTAETRQLRAFQMLVAMLNLGQTVEDAVQKVETAYGEKRALKATEAQLLAKVGASEMVADVVKDEKTNTVELILPSNTLFPAGGHKLSDAARRQLKLIAAEIAPVGADSEVEVVGHTDSQRPTGRAAYENNFALSSMRAGAVASALMTFGVPEKSLRVRGMGSLEPLVPEKDDAGRLVQANMAKNRRVHIILKTRSTRGSQR